MAKQEQQKAPTTRPPVVTVLGHVDHGKTSLLDYIRKTSVTADEFGGITQHIGAYQAEIAADGKKRTITFLDTPGHEAFVKMRSRGARAADIAILVVAADDSVKPQTIESIKQIKSAGIPMIVAANKMDTEGANIDRVKQDLAKHEVQVEGFGGDVPIVPVSAKTGKGVDLLLDTIVLLGDTLELTGDASAAGSAVVVETRVDKGKGMVATVIVQAGIIRPKTELYEGTSRIAKIRAMFDETGKPVVEAGPSKPVEILGFETLPHVGVVLHDHPVRPEQPAEPVAKKPVDELPDFLKPLEEQEATKLEVVVKADTAGSLEAVQANLHERVRVVGSGVGDITEKDVQLAKSANAFIVGFNVSIRSSVRKLAETEGVVYRTYTIIYELLQELEEVVAGMREVISREREIGRGTILASFPFNQRQVAGTRVISGRFAKGDRVKVMRGEQEIGRAKIASLRVGREDQNKVMQDNECGVLLDPDIDFDVNDDIIAFT